MTTAAEERRALGPAAVVAPSVAARWLPWGAQASLAWLRARGLVLEVPDVEGGVREVVIWGEVLDALRGVAVPESRRSGRLPAWSDPEG